MIEIRKYRIAYAAEVVKLWRQSFQRAMGLQEQNVFNEFESQLNYFETIDPDHVTIALDTATSNIAGFIAVVGNCVEHLYVHVDYQRKGVGGRLLEVALDKSPDDLYLFAFQQNRVAQQFYQSHGFVQVACGFAAQESNPWATDKNQLADIKYQLIPNQF